MDESEKSIRQVWNQTRVPVIYKTGKRENLMVKLPYNAENREWLREIGRRKPEWVKEQRYWSVPRAWFNDLVRRCIQRYDQVYLIQPHREQEKCAPACWNAEGIDCECSCQGAHHGEQNPAGRWYVISETFAARWRDRKLAVRLVRANA
jgi:hypothetical protein